MGRLLLIVMLILIALATCAVCYLATVARLWRTKGWQAALLAAVCFPYAYVWGWRHRRAAPNWMRAWTAASAMLVALIAFLESQMG